jgi:hypothetical protein
MKKLFLKIQTLTLIYLLGCSLNNTSELWEGVSDNTLRVVISEYIPYHEVSASNDIKTSVKERLDQRCSLLMASYIVMNLDRSKSSISTDVLFNNLMDEAIKQGKIISIDCSDNNYCRAIGEYNISEIQKNLEAIL